MIKDIKKIEVFVTSDNEYFTTKEEADSHEIEIARSFFITNLIEKYFSRSTSLDEDDLVDIFNESLPSIYCDMNTYFITPK